MKAAVQQYRPDISDGDHLIGAFVGDASGPTLIAVGSVHGNEPAGARALLVIAEQLRQMASDLNGRVYLLAGNTRALRENVRYIDRDLNRAWTPANMSSLRSKRARATSECRELDELDRTIDQILITSRSEVFVLDLHSTSAGGEPFATVGDTLRNRAFAQKFPVTILLGIEEQLEGTMLEYLNNAGAVTMGFEGGSHTSEHTFDNHTALVWLALLNAGILFENEIPELDRHRATLAAGKTRARVVEVRYRKGITADDGFKMNAGFNNFDPITAGQILANDRSGEVRATERGLILMPLYQPLGEDGFFIGREVAPFWLVVSGVLRRLRAQKLMTWLPGVRQESGDPDTLIVDTRLARFFPLQIFHLLGYRRRRWADRKLVVSRRKHDTVSPFTQ